MAKMEPALAVKLAERLMGGVPLSGNLDQETIAKAVTKLLSYCAPEHGRRAVSHAICNLEWLSVAGVKRSIAMTAPRPRSYEELCDQQKLPGCENAHRMTAEEIDAARVSHALLSPELN